MLNLQHLEIIMPEKTQTLAVRGYEATQLQAIAYSALDQLGWTIKYAGDSVLIAYIPGNWKKYSNEIIVETKDNEVAISSKMIHGETFDLMGRNKKNITSVLAAFEKAKTRATDAEIMEWKQKIEQLKEDTVKAVEIEQKQAEEVDKVMNFSKSNLYITYGIIAINVLVFVLMVAQGISLISPTGIDIIRWGANFSPLTLSGDWWRLLSCVFVHIGIIHLLFNMYALYMVGVYLEPLLGKKRYITAYLCTGIFASLVSLWWHDKPIASAGASGAIFGMYGVFLALLSTKLIPKQIRQSLLQSIGIFVVYNLIYGVKSGIDNAAHAGGLISGLVIGYLYYFGMKGENTSRKNGLIVAGVVVLTLGASFIFLQQNKVSDEVSSQARQELESFKYKDAEEFNDTYNTIIEIQDSALAPMRDTSLNDEQFLQQLKTISYPQWDRAESLAKKLKSYEVSIQSQAKAGLMLQYIEMRKKEIDLIEKEISGGDVSAKLDLLELRTKIGEIIAELEKL